MWVVLTTFRVKEQLGYLYSPPSIDRRRRSGERCELWARNRAWNLGSRYRARTSRPVHEAGQGLIFSGSNLPTQLDGVSVTVDGKAAYVCSISPTQLNVLSPGDAAQGSVPVQMTTALGKSNVVSALEATFSPALFTFSQQGGSMWLRFARMALTLPRRVS